MHGIGRQVGLVDGIFILLKHVLHVIPRKPALHVIPRTHVLHVIPRYTFCAWYAGGVRREEGKER